jgi:hypothetical protein
MSTIQQFGSHPDADQLNAFVEHGLPEHERLATLAHLADCVECRQIVFLAQEAIGDENRVAEILPNRVPWFRRWNLVWPAAAAVACVLVTTLLVRNVQSHHPSQQALQDHQPLAVTPLSEAPSPQPPPSVAAAPKVIPRPIQPHPTGTHREGTPSTAVRSTSFINGDQITPSQALTNLPINGRNFQTLTPLAQGNASVHGAITAAAPQPSMSPSPTAPANPVSTDQLTPVQNASVAAQRQNFAQHTVSPTPAPGSQTQNATVDVSSAAPAIQTENATVTAGALEAVTVSAAPVANLSLPSKLPAISRVSNGEESLGLDSGGGLFISQNAGVNWQPIPQRWSGKMVKINLAPLSNTEPPEAKKAAPLGAMKSAATLGGVSRTSSAKKRGFVATTDTGEVWISSDGFEWQKR